MHYNIIVLIDPANFPPYSIDFGAATRSEAIGIMEREWEYFIDTRVVDLQIGVINSMGQCTDERCLDDAQTYYDHRMYRIGETERRFLDLCVPLADREDRRLYETNIIIGYRDNLDAQISVALRSPSAPITHQYLEECWAEHLFRQEIRREEVLKEIPLDVAREILPSLFD